MRYKRNEIRIIGWNVWVGVPYLDISSLRSPKVLDELFSVKSSAHDDKPEFITSLILGFR